MFIVTIVIAIVAAILLSLVGTAAAAIVLSYWFGLPFIVALPFLFWTYLSLWLVIPLCLVAHLTVMAVTRNDVWVHVVAVFLALVL